jgi:hypothetical protein
MVAITGEERIMAIIAGRLDKDAGGHRTGAARLSLQAGKLLSSFPQQYSIGPAQGLFIAAIASIPQLVQARLQKGDFLPQIIRPRMAPPRMLRTHNEMTIHRYLLQSIRMYSLKRLIILRD